MRFKCYLNPFARLTAGVALSTLGWLALPAPAQNAPGVTAAETAEHKARMDDSQDLKEDVREAMAKNASEAAAEAVRKMLAIARVEELYWRRANIEPALRLAAASVAGLERLATAVRSAGSPAARQAFGEVESTCRECHDAHPERARDRVRSGETGRRQ